MTLWDDLRNRLHGRIVVLGIGNPLRGDDAAGSMVAKILASTAVEAVDGEDAPERYLGHVIATQPDTVVIVDAADLGAPPGSVALLEPGQLEAIWPVPHRVPVGLLGQYLKHATRADVVVVAVQPGHLEPGAPTSREVEQTVQDLADVLAGLGVRVDAAPVAGRSGGVSVPW